MEGNAHPTEPQSSIDITRATKQRRNHSDEDSESDKSGMAAFAHDATLLPNGSRSLSSIAEQAAALGFVFALGAYFTVFLLITASEWWRLPAFFSILSLFHFLEFWTTARFNVPVVRASSFLLFNNGAAYNIAHSLATIEILVSRIFPSYGSYSVRPYTVGAGVLLVVIGQAVRSFAMAQAGTNFNHTPAKTRREGHVLVTSGVYAWLRHPSYFGFFWWAIGTQVLVGNKACLVGYIMVLWDFFRKRIVNEERYLVEFFAKDYEAFRKRTGTGIPFIK